jgi:hypothetical protein
MSTLSLGKIEVHKMNFKVLATWRNIEESLLSIYEKYTYSHYVGSTCQEPTGWFVKWQLIISWYSLFNLISIIGEKKKKKKKKKGRRILQSKSHVHDT